MLRSILATAPTLPDTGTDIAAFITVAITGIGAIVAVVVGGYFAFLLIRKGMKWGKTALG